MLTAEEHAAVQRARKAVRSLRAQDRRRRGLTPVVSWERSPGGYRRCVVCGRWCSESQTAGHTGPLRFCEDCFLARELRVASLQALASARSAVLTGAA